MAVWLVLCDAVDRHGVWAFERLSSHGCLPIELVTTQELLGAARWVYVRDATAAHSEVALADGRKFTSSDVQGVLNRIAGLPQDAFLSVPSEDRGYAGQEMGAFLLAWLASLRNVLNPPSASGLCGQWRSVAEWCLMAAQAGLPTLAYERQVTKQPDDERGVSVVSSGAALVFGTAGLVAPQPLIKFEPACIRLARLSRTPLLQINFINLGEAGGDGWFFEGATPLPELSLSGEYGIELLARALGAPDTA